MALGSTLILASGSYWLTESALSVDKALTLTEAGAELRCSSQNHIRWLSCLNDRRVGLPRCATLRQAHDPV